MTKKLFNEDSHLEEFEATVIDCKEVKEGYQIILDQTAFFPEGGGQSSDTGKIAGVSVLDVREKVEVIYHYSKEPLQIGQKVTGTIDYQERFSKMQQHTGEHIISGLVHQIYGYDNIGFHLGKEKVTMDFNGELTPIELRDIEYKANEVVASNKRIQVSYPSKEELTRMEYRSKIEIDGQVRIVEIPGVDRCACCAPHVNYTGEVGIVKITSAEKYKGGTRVYLLCGFRALEDYKSKENNVNKISVLLSAKSETIAEAVDNLKQELFNLKSKISNLLDKQVLVAINSIDVNSENVFLFEDEFDSNAMRRFINGATEKCRGLCGVFVGNDMDGYRYVLGSTSLDVRPYSKRLNEEFEGKGGGKPEMVQGSITAKRIDIEKLLSNEK